MVFCSSLFCLLHSNVSPCSYLDNNHRKSYYAFIIMVSPGIFESFWAAPLYPEVLDTVPSQNEYFPKSSHHTVWTCRFYRSCSHSYRHSSGPQQWNINSLRGPQEGTTPIIKSLKKWRRKWSPLNSPELCAGNSSLSRPNQQGVLRNWIIL